MNFKDRGVSKKLLISTAALLVIPVILVSILIVVYSEYNAERLKEKYNMPTAEFQFFPDAINVYDKLITPYFEALQSVAEKESEMLLNAEVLEKLNLELLHLESYLIIQADGVITFIGDAEAYNELDKTILRYEHVSSDSGFSTYVGGDKPVMVKSFQFIYRGNEDGYAYIVTDVSKALPDVDMFMTVSASMIFIAMLIISTIIISIISTRYVIPIQELEIYLTKILQGNLDIKINTRGGYEIQNLAKVVEETKTALGARRDVFTEQEEEMRDMLSNITHDLKTPITSIKGYTEALVDGLAAEQGKEDEYKKIILRKANDLDKLISELSMYSQVNLKALLYNFTELNIKDYFDDCAEEFEMDLENKGMQFIYANYLNDMTIIDADPSQLSRVMHNIVNNAVKYMDKKNGRVILSVNEDEVGIKIKLEDNGVGIDGDEVYHIFDRFFRTDRSRNSSTGGSGIGLAIAKEIINEHKGEIWATSKLGVGTSIHITLPKITEEKESE